MKVEIEASIWCSDQVRPLFPDALQSRKSWQMIPPDNTIVLYEMKMRTTMGLCSQALSTETPLNWLILISTYQTELLWNSFMRIQTPSVKKIHLKQNIFAKMHPDYYNKLCNLKDSLISLSIESCIFKQKTLTST